MGTNSGEKKGLKKFFCHRSPAGPSNSIGGVIMHTKINKETLVQRAAGGDRAALEETLAGVQELVFNLSLRMLGTFHDAEDASQDILVKVMTRLSSFRGRAPSTPGYSASRSTTCGTTKSTCSPSAPSALSSTGRTSAAAGPRTCRT